jgi:hypothetical protein
MTRGQKIRTVLCLMTLFADRSHARGDVIMTGVGNSAGSATLSNRDGYSTSFSASGVNPFTLAAQSLSLDDGQGTVSGAVDLIQAPDHSSAGLSPGFTLTNTTSADTLGFGITSVAQLAVINTGPFQYYYPYDLASSGSISGTIASGGEAFFYLNVGISDGETNPIDGFIIAFDVRTPGAFNIPFSQLNQESAFGAPDYENIVNLSVSMSMSLAGPGTFTYDPGIGLIDPAIVPEPGSFLTLASGLGLIISARKWKSILRKK